MPQATPKSTAPSDAEIKTLNSLVQTHLAVIDKQEKELGEIASGKRCLTKEGPEFPAFSLAKDAASLVKAQTTKLSLLIINEPFTISAIIRELQHITQASYQLELAAQACDPTTHSKTIKTELASLCLDILRSWRLFLRSIPKDGKAIAKQAVESAGLASTGRLWSACDRLVELSSENGLHNHLLNLVNSEKELIKDALEELKEWGDSTDSSDDNDSVTSGDYHNYHHDPQAAIDAIVGAFMCLLVRCSLSVISANLLVIGRWVLAHTSPTTIPMRYDRDWRHVPSASGLSRYCTRASSAAGCSPSQLYLSRLRQMSHPDLMRLSRCSKNFRAQLTSWPVPFMIWMRTRSIGSWTNALWRRLPSRSS